MKLIERTFYPDKRKDMTGTPDVKVITGVRSSGMPGLPEGFPGHVRQTDPDADIIRVNYSLSEYEALPEYHKLSQYVEQAYQRCMILLAFFAILIAVLLTIRRYSRNYPETRLRSAGRGSGCSGQSDPTACPVSGYERR